MIAGLDHIALPMEDVEAMLAFYEGLGAHIIEEVPGFLHAVYLGVNKVNLHTPDAWQSPKFRLRGPVASPGCGDLCLVWQGSDEALLELLGSIKAELIEGPVERIGGRQQSGTSFYVRDPDRNLVEFIRYDS